LKGKGETITQRGPRVPEGGGALEEEALELGEHISGEEESPETNICIGGKGSGRKKKEYEDSN